jgi:PKD repeat protein
MYYKMKIFSSTLLFIFLSGFSLNSEAQQDWRAIMNNPNANFKDIQASFYKWNGSSKSPNGDLGAYKGKEEGEDGNYMLFKRWEWLMQARTYPTGNFPDKAKIATEYQEYLKNRNTLSPNKHAISSSAAWSYAGNTKNPLGGDAGRVNRIRINPSNSSILYACAPSGGLWVSTNSGSSWSTKTDNLPGLGTSDIAINPLNTKIMYLATGDGDGITGGETTPSTIGILKTTDGGTTWNPTSMYYTLSNSGPPQNTVNQLLINPANPDTLLAGTSFGLYITMDGGLSWNLVLNEDIRSIEFQPGNLSVVYAASYNAQFYKSTNGGQSFTQVAIPSSSGAGRMQLAVTPANNSYVYLLADNASDYTFFGLWLSTDTGRTFTLQSNSPNLLGENPNGSDTYGQGWYTLSLAASPTNASEIVVGGVNIWQSTNAGASWSILADIAGTGAPYVHADIHHLNYLNGTTLYAACDGGVSVTTNSGKSFNDLGSGLDIAEQYSIGLSADNASLYLTGWQDNGTNLYNGNWGEVLGGDGMVCFIDNTSDSYMYGEQYEGSFNRSSNGGATFTEIAISTSESAGWVTPWLQDPTSSQTLYGGYENIWKSTDRGSKWSAISAWGSSGNNVVAIAVAPSNDQYIYAAQYGAMYATANGGTTWTNITGSLPVGSVGITSIAVDNTNPLRLWVTFSGYSDGEKVYQSVNGGTTWTDISTGLPNLPVNCIVYQNGGAADAMYAGTDVGCYYRDTTTTGGEWVNYNTGLPNVMVSDLKIYYPGNLLVAATYGRGVWQVGLYTPATVAPAAAFSGYPTTVCAGSAVQFTDLSTNEPTSWSWTFTGGTPGTSTAENPSITYSVAGTYPVTMVATNSKGNNTATQTNYIVVDSLPVITSVTDATYNILTCLPSTFPYYQWYRGNAYIPGAENSEYTASTVGTYWVYVTDSNGCTSSRSVRVTVIGINNITDNNFVDIYPNPTTGILQLDFNTAMDGEYLLAIADPIGRIIYSGKVELAGPQTKSLDMSQYSKGVYFLTLTGNGERMVKKVVVY